MEPQVRDCNFEKKTKKHGCLGIVLLIITAALTFSVGLLIGATYATQILTAISAIVVLITILALLYIINIVLIICNKKK